MLESLRASYLMMVDPLKCIEEARARAGDFARLNLGWTQFILVSNPEWIERIFVDTGKTFIKDVMTQKMVHVWGNGLLSSEGEEWRWQRKLVQPAFHQGRLQAYSETMVAFAEATTADWRAGETRDVHHAMTNLTLGVVSDTLFGRRVESDQARIARCLEAIMDYFYFIQTAIGFFPAAEKIPVPSRRRFRAAIRDFDALIDETVRERSRSDATHEDLLSILLAAMRRPDGKMDRKLVRDELITLFLAGHETTALTLAFCWDLLARNPEADRAFRKELREVLGGRRPTHEDLPRLKFAEYVVKESMRLYPPVWITGREASEDCRLGPYAIRKGDQLLMPQWIVHRDARWFPDPLAFRPERWESEAAGAPKFAYFPFGGGPRFCIGNHFAMMEATLVLATIAQRFAFEAVESPARLIPSITIRPKGGLRLRLVAPPTA